MHHSVRDGILDWVNTCIRDLNNLPIFCDWLEDKGINNKKYKDLYQAWLKATYVGQAWYPDYKRDGNIVMSTYPYFTSSVTFYTSSGKLCWLFIRRLVQPCKGKRKLVMGHIAYPVRAYKVTNYKVVSGIANRPHITNPTSVVGAVVGNVGLYRWAINNLPGEIVEMLKSRLNSCSGVVYARLMECLGVCRKEVPGSKEYNSSITLLTELLGILPKEVVPWSNRLKSAINRRLKES